MSYREITFSDAVNEALKESMRKDPKVLCYGLGVTDPKAVFNTTSGLEEEFGNDRVFDIPCSENGITGIAVGASLRGYRSVLTHQRLDFALLSMDQIVNSAAKWHYMFGSQRSVPITIRMILGRGWGQGPTHSQNLQSWFAHIPGLKVVVPSNAHDAKGLLIASIFDPNPVIFLEHRWLHNSVGSIPDGYFETRIGAPKTVREGSDCTLVANSYMVPECLNAAKILAEEYGIETEIIDLNTVRPLVMDGIEKSAKKTKNVLVIDSGLSSFSISSEIVSRLALQHDDVTLNKLALRDISEPTSQALIQEYHNNSDDIVVSVLDMVGLGSDKFKKRRVNELKDIPGNWFRGPF